MRIKKTTATKKRKIYKKLQNMRYATSEDICTYIQENKKREMGDSKQQVHQAMS